MDLNTIFDQQIAYENSEVKVQWISWKIKPKREKHEQVYQRLHTAWEIQSAEKAKPSHLNKQNV